MAYYLEVKRPSSLKDGKLCLGSSYVSLSEWRMEPQHSEGCNTFGGKNSWGESGKMHLIDSRRLVMSAITLFSSDVGGASVKHQRP